MDLSKLGGKRSLGAISMAKSLMLLLNATHCALNPMYLNAMNSSWKQTKM